MKRIACLLLAYFTLAAPSSAADPVTPVVDSRQITPVLRSALLQSMPTPLGEKVLLWDHQKDCFVGVKWQGIKPVRQLSPRNDGHWQKVRLEAIDPTATLLLKIDDFQSPEPHRTTFTTTLALDVRMTHEQQLWKTGVRLLSTETRGRCRVNLKVNCELTTRTEPVAGRFLPNVVFRVRVTSAEVGYDNLVCEHILGLDGQAAKLAGEAAHRMLKQVKPQYERDLLERTNAAVVKAADTREVRVELEQLLRLRAK